jgi:hypothetical protein
MGMGINNPRHHILSGGINLTIVGAYRNLVADGGYLLARYQNIALDCLLFKNQRAILDYGSHK